MRRAVVAVGLAAFLGLTLAACPGAPPSGDDGMDGAGIDAGPGAPDAGASSGGLVVFFVVSPQPPAELGEGYTIDRFSLRLRDLRAIGDSAPGDERTSREYVELEWRESEGEAQVPGPIVFPDAPAGLYSRLAFVVQGLNDDDGIECRGEAPYGESVAGYEIEDDRMRAVDLDLAVDLEAGGSAVLTVELDLAAALAAVDFAGLELEDDGDLKVDGPARDAFVSALLASIVVREGPPADNP